MTACRPAAVLPLHAAAAAALQRRLVERAMRGTSRRAAGTESLSMFIEVDGIMRLGPNNLVFGPA
jgi:hypothetical protein